mmetsp:Transcript_7470/g.16386  ORF Transcript_7470/g.16386 Transcript_7470/m.16386 type:complete len:330 (+) Transcript_7470:407-1396(+)
MLGPLESRVSGSNEQRKKRWPSKDEAMHALAFGLAGDLLDRGQVGRADDAVSLGRRRLGAGELRHVTRLGGQLVEARVLEVGVEVVEEAVVLPRALDRTLRLRGCSGLCGAVLVHLARDADGVAIVRLAEDAVGRNDVAVGIVEGFDLDVEQLLVLVGVEVAEREGSDRGGGVPLAHDEHRELLVLERDLHVVDHEGGRVLLDGDGAVALLVHHAAGLARGVVLDLEDLARGRAHDPIGRRHLGAVHQPARPSEISLLELDVECEVLGREHHEGDVVLTAEVSARAVRQVEVGVLARDGWRARDLAVVARLVEERVGHAGVVLAVVDVN